MTIQHYEKTTAAAIQFEVKSLIDKASLTTQPTSIYATMPSRYQYRASRSVGYPLTQESQVKQGRGQLLCYTNEGALAISLEVDVFLGTGPQTVADDKGLTPFTAHKLGRVNMAGYPSYTVTGEGDSSGFVMSAARVFYELVPIADVSGRLKDVTLYHSTIMDTGQISESFLLMTEGAYGAPLKNVPTLASLKTATPEQITTSTPEFAASWVKLPVGLEGSDVVRLSYENVAKYGRLLATDSIRFSIAMLTGSQESDALSTVRAKMDTLSFEVTDHLAP